MAGLDAAQDELKKAVELNINPYLRAEIVSRINKIKADTLTASAKMANTSAHGTYPTVH
jgi:hypothetical protein